MENRLSREDIASLMMAMLSFISPDSSELILSTQNSSYTPQTHLNMSVSAPNRNTVVVLRCHWRSSFSHLKKIKSKKKKIKSINFIYFSLIYPQIIILTCINSQYEIFKWYVFHFKIHTISVKSGLHFTQSCTSKSRFVTFQGLNNLLCLTTTVSDIWFQLLFPCNFSPLQSFSLMPPDPHYLPCDQ